MNNKDETLKILDDMKHDWKIWIHFDKPFDTDMYKNIIKLQDLIEKQRINKIGIGVK